MLNPIVKFLPLSLLIFAQAIAAIPAQATPTTPQLLAQAFKAPLGANVADRRRTPPPRASGDCSVDDLKLASLLPGEEFGMPLTGDANPSFYVYVPKINADYLEFSVFKGRKSIYKTQLAVPETAGIVEVSLPASVMLEAGQNSAGKPIAYQWYFNVVCDSSDRSNDLKTNGWVHRLADVETSEQSATELAEAGIWYDALEAAYEEEQEAADNLLESVGLTDFMGIPLVSVFSMDADVSDSSY